MPGMKRQYSKVSGYKKPGAARKRLSMGPSTGQRVLGGYHKTTVRLRVSTAQQNNKYTVNQLAIALGAIATGTNTCNPVCGSFRLLGFKVIGPSPSASSITAVSVQEAGDETNARNVLINSSNTEGVSPKVFLKPRATSVCGQWQNVRESRDLVEVSAPVGSIIEYTVVWRLLEDNESPISVVTGTSMTSGRFYYPSWNAALVPIV